MWAKAVGKRKKCCNIRQIRVRPLAVGLVVVWLAQELQIQVMSSLVTSAVLPFLPYRFWITMSKAQGICVKSNPKLPTSKWRLQVISYLKSVMNPIFRIWTQWIKKTEMDKTKWLQRVERPILLLNYGASRGFDIWVSSTSFQKNKLWILLPLRAI